VHRSVLFTLYGRYARQRRNQYRHAMHEGRPRLVLRGAGRMAGFHALAIGARGPHPDRRIRRSRRENVLNRSAALGATSFDEADEQDDRDDRDRTKQRAERDRTLVALPDRRLAEQHDAAWVS
jgi:hypothetical protein